MKTRILFVDDESYVLDGLRRMLRAMRSEWEMVFVPSAQEALDRMAEQPFDVLVTDVRMPGMDGTELLTRVRQQYPRTIRIALSGQSSEEVLVRTIGPSHQFLSKPCDPESIRSTIKRACALRGHLADERLQGMISGLTSLPSLPAHYTRIVDKLQAPNTSAVELGEIISQDVGMATKILQLVNSSYFGLSHRVTTPADAAALLGIDTLKALVLSVGIFNSDGQAGGRLVDALSSHSHRVGAMARRIAETEDAPPQLSEQVYVAALLHDVGKLVLLDSFSAEYARLLAWAELQHEPTWMVEEQAFAATHADVGAYLLGLWGFTDDIIEAAAFHHCPGACLARAFGPLSVVHAANVLEHESRSPGDARAELDTAYLTELGLVDRLDAWRQACLDPCMREPRCACENPLR